MIESIVAGRRLGLADDLLQEDIGLIGFPPGFGGGKTHTPPPTIERDRGDRHAVLQVGEVPRAGADVGQSPTWPMRPRASRSAARARNNRLLTVPIGVPSTSAMSP